MNKEVVLLFLSEHVLSTCTVHVPSGPTKAKSCIAASVSNPVETETAKRRWASCFACLGGERRRCFTMVSNWAMDQRGFWLL